MLDSKRESVFQCAYSIGISYSDERLQICSRSARARNSSDFAPTRLGTSRIHETDPEDYANVWAVNYFGLCYAAKHLIPLMLNPQSESKLLINITNLTSHMTTGVPNAYTASKLAFNRLIQYIAENYKDDGLFSIAVHPSGVRTPGAEKLPETLIASRFSILEQPACR